MESSRVTEFHADAIGVHIGVARPMGKWYSTRLMPIAIRLCQANVDLMADRHGRPIPIPPTLTEFLRKLSASVCPR